MQSMAREVLRYLWNRITWKVVIAATLPIVVALAAGIALGWWSWKTLIGWNALVDYINPRGATQKKEALQVYAVIVAGLIASITAAVGLANLRLTRRNLEQQRELEAERAQGTALQAYYEQMGKLLIDNQLRTTEKKEVRELARAQTLTLVRELGAHRMGSLLVFLQSAGLIESKNPAVELVGANLEDANLGGAFLRGTNLRETNLQGANLDSANLRYANLGLANLPGANLQGANLRGANLHGADLQYANLHGADLGGTGATNEQLAQARYLKGATMPDGTKHD